MTAGTVLSVLTVLSVVSVLSGCTDGRPPPTTLRVLASSELADMRPVLDQLRAETGVELRMDFQDTVDASGALSDGADDHDLAWLSTDRYYQLALNRIGHTGPRPLATRIMLSPVAVGVKPAVAAALRRSTPDSQPSWADLADAAAAGSLRFAMADPHTSGSGLGALVGVGTAAAGTGGVLRLVDVTCDRLRGFFAGHTRSAATTAALTDEFVAHEGELDALVSYESVLLSLNGSGRLREPLEIVYPRDGIVESDYPLLLLDPDRREAYDRVVDWLRTPAAQKRIMELTLRRPLEPSVERDPRLRTTVGNALYFPDQQEVVDKLLANYTDPSLRSPTRVIFALDYSGSMQGPRIDALRATFAGLSGSAGASGFYRFYHGETFTVLRFGGSVLDERDFTVNGPADLGALREYLAADSFDDSTAVWSTLDYAYGRAAAFLDAVPDQRISIVLMTDGESNAGIDLPEFLGHARPPVPTFTISYGEADHGELDQVARATGGFAVDADAVSLLGAFREIRGC